jgi:hypothetical protein
MRDARCPMPWLGPNCQNAWKGFQSDKMLKKKCVVLGHGIVERFVGRQASSPKFDE